MMIWHAYVVAPQQEFRVQEDMIKLGARTLVPAEWVWRRVRNGAKPAALRRPVIPGYVFGAFVGGVPYQPLRLVRGLKGLVGFGGVPSVIPSPAIPGLQALERPKDHQAPAKFRLGDAIRIKRGLHAELAAVVHGLQGGEVLAIVTLFGKSHSVRVNEREVEAA
jgi:transcription antitermination factor NusG